MKNIESIEVIQSNKVSKGSIDDENSIVNDKKLNSIRARGFTQTEIQEVNKYVLTNVPYSVLEQIFPLTENVINKCTVFITVHRIIKSCSGYALNESLRNKLDKLLDEISDVYREVYNNLITYQTGEIGSGDKYDILVNVLKDKEKNEKINNLIDIFLVFAEKQTLFNLDRITGVKSDTTEGDQIVEELMNIDD